MKSFLRNILNTSRKVSAFALIEVLVAISLLATTIITVTTLSISMMRANALNHNHLIATELAREGLEITRVVRDDNWANYRNWLTDIYTGTGQYAFTVDSNSINELWNIQPYSSLVGARLYKEELLGYGYTKYSHDNSGDETPFYRTITVYPLVENGDAPTSEYPSGKYVQSLSDTYVLKVLVESKVWWQYRDTTKEITLYTELTDWNG